MSKPTEFNQIGESDIHGGPDSSPPLVSWLQDIVDEAVQLIAEDLRIAREGLGISLTEAAERVKLEPWAYRALEEGRGSRDRDSLVVMLAAAARLGLQEVRVTYVEEVDQYSKLSLLGNGDPVSEKRPAIFVDKLRLKVDKLKFQEVFINPFQVMEILAGYGPNETLESRQSVDKQLIELWIAAVFTLCLDQSHDY